MLSSLCGHCLPSCQAERQAPGGLLVFVCLHLLVTVCHICGGVGECSVFVDVVCVCVVVVVVVVAVVVVWGVVNGLCDDGGGGCLGRS